MSNKRKRNGATAPAAPCRVALVSLGCPKNLVDSEKMMATLAEGGCLVGAPMDEADVVVVNTCGFLAAARDESLEAIRQAVGQKAVAARRVVVAGCLANRDGEKLFHAVKGIDAVVGVNDRDAILQAVRDTQPFLRITPTATTKTATNVPVNTVNKKLPGRRDAVQSTIAHRKSTRVAPSEIVSDAGRFRLTPRHTAYLRISEGCSQKCTFCTIPAIRGPFRSKTPEQVLREARELLADGAVELNIIGQDTTSYGMDLPGEPTLADLLRRLDALHGARWIRLMYAYPMRFTEELIDTMAACKHVVPYVDIPLQHISDPVLRRMGRRTTQAQTVALLNQLRRRIPSIAIRTTFIVGFPGETDAHFRELLEFVTTFQFDALGVFEFSPEPGTPAMKLKGRVPASVKAQRARQIMLAQRRIALAANRRQVGRKIQVLVDGVDAAGRCVGRHCGQAPDIDSLCLLTRPRPAGTIVAATIIGYDGYDLRVE